MSGIRTFFLRAPHWQVFVVLVGLLCAVQIVVVASKASDHGTLGMPLSALLAAEVGSVLTAYWFWCLGYFLHSRAQIGFRLSLGFFAFTLLYPIVYIAFFQMVFERIRPAYFVAMFPLHLLALACLISNVDFVSKNLLLAEKQRRVTFNEYVWPFFLFLIFPIGIWFLQPRINRLYAGSASQQPTEAQMLSR